MDDSAIMYNEIIESYEEDTEAKSYNETNFKEKKANCKTQNFYILLAFLLISIALLVAVSIYCYVIKCRANKNIYYHLNLQITNQKKWYIKNE